MAKRVLIPILLLLLAVLAAAAFLIVLLCRPTLVVSDREAPLFQSSLSLNVVEYPHEGDIYSPVAAIYAMQDGLDVSRLACFGLSEEAASSFGTVYAVDEMAMWNLVYDSYPDAAVLYDSTDLKSGGLPYTEANGEQGPFVPQGTELMKMLFNL